MSNTEELMSEFYNTLVQIRYPKITTAVAKNLKFTILKGENRLSLLSWLLCEKSPTIATTLQKLKGYTLEAELFKRYSEIGICCDKNFLLGNCSFEEQLPTLRLLLEFIKCVFIGFPNNEDIGKESIDDILNVYINEDPNTASCYIQPKLTYSESMIYFDNLDKYLNDHERLCSIREPNMINGIEVNISEDEKKEDEAEIDRDSLFHAEKKNFIEAFSKIKSWPTFNTKNEKNNLCSMDEDINDISTNLSSLTQFLQARAEILNANVPTGINELHTQLSEIVEETATHTEEAKRACTDNY